MMRLALALVVLVVASPVMAAGVIRCTAKGHDPVTISLDSDRFKGRPISCLTGSFVADMTPCAPNKAFALSAPTGTAAIVAVVDRWQEYANHNGGVVGFFQTPETISFTGGFNSPDGGLVDEWAFKADRLAGTAKLTQKGSADIAYSCSKASQKF